MVNGLSVYLFAVPIQASVACLAMMVFSMLSLFASSRFNPTIAQSSDPACSMQLAAKPNATASSATPPGKPSCCQIWQRDDRIKANQLSCN
jgi:hypothetical protein